MGEDMNKENYMNDLIKKILILNQKIWKKDLNTSKIRNWLENFKGYSGISVLDEQLHALHLLSQFTFFGLKETSAIVRAMMEDLFINDLIMCIKTKKEIQNEIMLRMDLVDELNNTCFISVGHESESGVLMSYHFRTENNFSVSFFGRNDSSKRIVLLDDLCGSGQTVLDYIYANREVFSKKIIHYYCMVATKKGFNLIKRAHPDLICKAVYVLDETYEVFHERSRYFIDCPSFILKEYSKTFATCYGEMYETPEEALGFDNCQLLLGFTHNTPDNTLPIMWASQMTCPPFPRKVKNK